MPGFSLVWFGSLFLPNREPNHSSVWEKGGGAEGKAPDWFKELKAKNKQEKGHVAVAKSDTHSTGSKSLAAFNNVGEPNNTKNLKLQKHLQGRNADGNLLCIAKDTCMVEWNNETTCNLPPATPVFLLTTNEHTLMSTDGHIFHLDSGATSHCSLECSDFVELDTIPT